PTLAAEPGEPAERPNEGLLHQVVHVRLEASRADQEAGERAGVTADQFGRRRLVATVPGGDQRRIGWNRGDGLGGRHARYGGRWSSEQIKGGRGGNGRQQAAAEHPCRLCRLLPPCAVLPPLKSSVPAS